ncbi:MAG: glycoside hydrolase family 3 C-terminal domain-containing protein [Bacteroidales bacterium]|nr:glycoside hydrolase family 3 C-terminal domain-containing protein [Bacteroidales bacterium]
MKSSISLLILICIAMIAVNSCKTEEENIDQRVEKLLSQLTLEEKVSLIHGNTFFTTPAIPRLGIPALHLSDGPCGIREEMNPHDWNVANATNDAVSYFPSLVALASTWNQDLAAQFGKVYAEEAIIRGKNIMLAPGLNIHRTPLNGRNWEYMSEDPFLTGKMAVSFITSAQSGGIAVCAKHFALNNQELARDTINVEASERALREIYLPAFEAAVKDGGVLSLMGAYNRFRGQHASENSYLLQDILKKEWGFRGLVMSDWGAAHHTLESANNGLDLEMYPINGKKGDYYLGQRLLDSIKAGKVDAKVVDDKVRRILYVMCKLDMIGKPETDTTGMAAKLATPERAAAALAVADEAIVLLKNNSNTLPIDLKKTKTIAVIGDNATRKHAYGGLSTTIKAKYEIPPLEGLQKRFGTDVTVKFAQGYAMSKDLNAKDPKLVAEAVNLAKTCDQVIIIGGLNHEPGNDCEGSDKPNMNLPYGQDDLIKAVLEVKPEAIVVIIAGTPVDMSSWIGKANSLIYTSYIGMETGTALARVLTGDVNPSGKMTYTLPVKLEDSPSVVLGEYPGSNGTVNYKDDLLVGYRYFDTKAVKPLFPFGFGLSYTSFEYSDLKVETGKEKESLNCVVSFSIKNTGKVEGKEIAEVYVKDAQSTLSRPDKELKGFTKVSLKPGESKRVEVTLDKRAFQYYDPEKKDWVLEPGKFMLKVGSSCDKILLEKEIEL